MPQTIYDSIEIGRKEGVRGEEEFEDDRRGKKQLLNWNQY